MLALIGLLRQKVSIFQYRFEQGHLLSSTVSEARKEGRADY